jgi:hypothetical protein
MKNLTIISILILAIINLNCGSSEIAEKDQWKEKYNIEPNTGVLFGKVKTIDVFEGKEVVIYLKEDWNNIPFAYDTVSTNGYFLIKNISEGKHFIDVVEAYNFTPQKRPSVVMNARPFTGYRCGTFFIIINNETIQYINVTVPGELIHKLPMVWDRDPPEQKAFLDSCQLIQDQEELNEENYLKIINLKNGG